MSQLSFSDAEGQAKRKKTRREKFLEEMDQLLPWQAMEKPIRKYYSKSTRGRKPYPLPAMLRIHCMQLFYNLSDPGMEDSLYEVESMRPEVGQTRRVHLPEVTGALERCRRSWCLERCHPIHKKLI